MNEAVVVTEVVEAVVGDVVDADVAVVEAVTFVPGRSRLRLASKRRRGSTMATIRAFAWPEARTRRVRCLRCSKEFPSTGKNIRTCAACRRRVWSLGDAEILPDERGGRSTPHGRPDY